jgi:hypothetical protein
LISLEISGIRQHALASAYGEGLFPVREAQLIDRVLRAVSLLVLVSIVLFYAVQLPILLSSDAHWLIVAAAIISSPLAVIAFFAIVFTPRILVISSIFLKTVTLTALFCCAIFGPIVWLFRYFDTLTLPHEVPVAGVQKTTIRTFTVEGEEQNEGLHPHIRWTKTPDFVHVYRGISPINRVFFLTSTVCLVRPTQVRRVFLIGQ